MITSKQKMYVISATAIVVALTLGVYFVYFQQDADKDVEQIRQQVFINLEKVRVNSVDEERKTMMLQLDFTIINNSDKILTFKRIDYELLANGKSLGSSFVSGGHGTDARPLISVKTTVSFPAEFAFYYSEETKGIWDLLAKNKENAISWRAQGIAELLYSASDIIYVEFDQSA